MMHLGSVCWWSFTFGCALSQITYPKALMVSKPRRSVRISCDVDSSVPLTSYNLHWYQKKETFQRILYLTTGGKIAERDKVFSTRFQASNRDQRSILTITNAKPEDSGHYYCAYWGSHCGKMKQKPNQKHLLMLHSHTNHKVSDRWHRNWHFFILLVTSAKP
ncbi:hypothetical protein GN956_G27038, partial [Arapaima gigas]